MASSCGETAKLLRDTAGLNVVVVSLQFGAIKPNEAAMSLETRTALEEKGWHVVTAAHALSAGERGISSKFNGVYPLEIIAAALRMFGQGTKVAIEVATMAADAGYIHTDVPVIAIGGTGRGADTALILRAANSSRLLETKVEEILCKPYI